MNNSPINQSPYLQTSQRFPTEAKDLAFQVDLTYVSIANAINNRTISLFPTTRPAVNGEGWYIQNKRKQGAFRQVYSFNSTVSIPHNINPLDVERFVRLYGNYTDGTNWYGLLSASTVAIAGQISFYVTATDIVFVLGGGAPSLTLGTIVLEWLSQP